MKGITICAALVVIFAVTIVSSTPVNTEHQVNHKQVATVQLANFNNAAHKAIITPNDWLSDLIRLITGKDVGNLLIRISEAMDGLDKLVKQAESELEAVLVNVGKEAQDEIEAVVQDALHEATKIISPILEKLGLVLPAIENKAKIMDISDLIKIIIGMTLEELLTMIGKALIKLDEIVLDTADRLEKIAQTTAKSAAEEIQNIIDNTLTKAKAIIKPVLDILDQLLPLNLVISKRQITKIDQHLVRIYPKSAF